MKVSGVALKPHSQSIGSSGIEKKWPAEELKKGAASLNGCTVYAGDDRTVSGVIGSVIEASYEEGVGVTYEAIIEDEEIGRKIKEGTVELAPRLYHDDLGRNPDEPVIVSDVEFDALFTTPEATESVPGHLMVDGILQP